MSLDNVANSLPAARADAARGASTASARTDSAVPEGGFAALMQSLGDAAGAGDPSSGSGESTSHDKTATGADGLGLDPSAAASAAAAAVVAAAPAARDLTPTANRVANGATPGTQDGGTRVASGSTAATASRAGATSTPGSTAAGAGTLTGSTTTPYLRQAALLQQLAGAATSADGQTSNVTGQTMPDGSANATVTALLGDAGATPVTSASALPTDGTALTLHLQTLLSDALQGSAATNGGPALGADGLTTLALAGLGDPAGRPLTRSGTSSGQDAGSAGIALLGATTSANDVQVDVPAAAPDAGATTEMRVAQQVTYWVGQGVQSASMEVQGIDEKPIHVSIALQGQEASVNFQAEQLQTQQILQASAPHLRDLLQSQGLVLASLTVGGSGTGSAGSGTSGSASRDAPGGRQGQVLVPEVTTQASTAVGSGRQGAALDLFV